MNDSIKRVAIAAIIVLSLASCRKESDTVRNYSYYDAILWDEAMTSYGLKFKILWEGLNTNYSIWDYEKEHGLDWDAVYDKYYPKFVELDTLSKKRTITDGELETLLHEVLDPLHDGHMSIDMTNHMTGNTIKIDPNETRIRKEREADYYESRSNDGRLLLPYLQYYKDIPGKIIDFKSVDARAGIQLIDFDNALSAWAQKILAYTSGKTILTDEELAYEQVALTIEEELRQVRSLYGDELIQAINALALKYAYLNIDGVHVMDQDMLNEGITMTYALFEGNIAYLTFDAFRITPFLTTFVTNKHLLQPYAQQLAAEVADVWLSWFNAIQDLHEAGQLGGVIIDVRGNQGGYSSDFQFVLGALVPSGGLHVTDVRFKRGIGRYDYSPLMPNLMATYVGPHVTVTEPIVVIANANSVSMAEATSLGTTVVENAKLVGVRTWGGMCSLYPSEYYSYTYTGHIGVDGQTPVFVYCPMQATFTRDGKIMEGVGVTPDIEVHLDKAAWNNGKGPDSQLDRAIQYITTGK